ncbi:citrate lyase acyl carrier protein [Candidatus Epulonipiscium fishelsonii]|nr:citrate lyase acyl carrier protein [Epulopiscium sp. SCG-C06WGA-EpuloA1]
MRIEKIVKAGTIESSDISIILEPTEEDEIVVDLTSVVKHQYGASIEKTIRKILNKYNVTGVNVIANDRGALDCTIEARVETALERAGIEVDI